MVRGTLLLILGILVMDGLCSTLNLEVSIQNGNTSEINNRAGLDTYPAVGSTSVQSSRIKYNGEQ